LAWRITLNDTGMTRKLQASAIGYRTRISLTATALPSEVRRAMPTMSPELLMPLPVATDKYFQSLRTGNSTKLKRGSAKAAPAAANAT
jgi:hypothetical protein